MKKHNNEITYEFENPNDKRATLLLIKMAIIEKLLSSHT